MRLPSPLFGEFLVACHVQPTSTSISTQDSDFQWVFDVGQPDEPRFLEQLARQPLMVQDFIRDVSLNWELKLMFFDREYSHSVTRPPTHRDPGGSPRNEYLLSLLGEKEVLPCFPCRDVIQKAARVLDLIPGPLSYARVDLVIGRLGLEEGYDGKTTDSFGSTGAPDASFWQELGFVLDEPIDRREAHPATSMHRRVYLMEVELIEPSLYLSPGSAQTLGDLVLERMKEDSQ